MSYLLRRVPGYLLLVAGVVTFAIAAPGVAASSQPTLSVVGLPPALTLGGGRSGLIKAVFATSNSAALHTVLKLTSSQPITPTQLPSRCAAMASSESTTIICELSYVGPGTTVSKLIEFQSPAACGTTCSLTLTGTVTFAAGSSEASQTITSSSVIRLFSPADQIAADGNCVTAPSTLGTLASASAKQATRVSFGLADAPLPCTPAAAGVDPQEAPTPLHTRISFVALPRLQQLATAQVSFYRRGINASNFVLYELANYSFGTRVTSSTPFFPVPPCQNGAIPAGGPKGIPNVTFDACVKSQAPFGEGGAIVTLLVRGSGDPGFAG